MNFAHFLAFLTFTGSTINRKVLEKELVDRGFLKAVLDRAVDIGVRALSLLTMLLEFGVFRGCRFSAIATSSRTVASLSSALRRNCSVSGLDC